MPATVTALVIALLAFLPGGLYTWSFEQQAGRWGANATDRLQRFGGASAIFLALELPLVYQCYRLFVATDDLSKGHPLPAWVWAVPIALVLVPIALGRFAGRSAYNVSLGCDCSRDRRQLPEPGMTCSHRPTSPVGFFWNLRSAAG
jgi:hypothetical protein